MYSSCLDHINLEGSEQGLSFNPSTNLSALTGIDLALANPEPLISLPVARIGGLGIAERGRASDPSEKLFPQTLVL